MWNVELNNVHVCVVAISFWVETLNSIFFTFFFILQLYFLWQCESVLFSCVKCIHACWPHKWEESNTKKNHSSSECQNRKTATNRLPVAIQKIGQMAFCALFFLKFMPLNWVSSIWKCELCDRKAVSVFEIEIFRPEHMHKLKVLLHMRMYIAVSFCLTSF